MLHVKKTNKLIAQIIDDILEKKNIELNLTKVQDIYKQVLSEPFTMTSIIWGGIIHELATYSVNQIEELIYLKKSLEKTNWQTYALKHDLTLKLDPTYFEKFNLLFQLINEHKQCILQKASLTESSLDLREELFNFYFYTETNENIGDYLLKYIIHVYLTLPLPPKELFNVIDEYSSILPTNANDNVTNLLNFIDILILKIKGEGILYIDIYTTKDSLNIINFR